MKKDYIAIAKRQEQALQEQKEKEKTAIRKYVKIDKFKDEYWWIFYKDKNEMYTINKNGIGSITVTHENIDSIKFDRIENLLKYKEVIE